MDLLFVMLEALVPVLVAAVGVWLFGLLKTKVAPALGKAPPLVQQMAFALFSILAIFGGSALGLPLPGEVGQWTLATVNSVLTVLSGFGIHAIKKALQAA